MPSTHDRTVTDPRAMPRHCDRGQGGVTRDLRPVLAPSPTQWGHVTVHLVAIGRPSKEHWGHCVVLLDGCCRDPVQDFEGMHRPYRYPRTSETRRVKETPVPVGRSDALDFASSRSRRKRHSGGACDRHGHREARLTRPVARAGEVKLPLSSLSSAAARALRHHQPCPC